MLSKMISLKSVPSNNKKKSAKKWLGYGLAAGAALQLYYVQEMIAALIIFAVLFAVVAVGALFLFVLDSVGQRTVAWAEPRTSRFARTAHRGWELSLPLRRKLLRRLNPA